MSDLEKLEIKILALADWTPTESILKMVKTYNPDLICTLGDFSKESLEDLGQIKNIPKLGVYGNHCTRGYFQELGIFDLHLNVFEFRGLKFGGFEGCVKYKDTGYEPMFTQEECSKLMQNFPKVDIFLSHCPPFGINDNPQDISHTGFLALREYLDKYKPKAWLHGHTYPTDIIYEYEKTNIYYIDGQAIVYLNQLIPHHF